MVPLKSYLHTETNLKTYGLLSSVFRVSRIRSVRAFFRFVYFSYVLVQFREVTVFFSQFCHSRGDWLGKPANIKVENNGAVGYVRSSLTVHNPSVCVHKTE